MAMLFPPGYQFADTNGKALNGGGVVFFENGTTTLKNVFTDAALTSGATNSETTTPKGQPLNAAGRFLQGDLFGSGTYTVVIFDSNGSTIKSSDDFGPVGEPLRVANGTAGAPAYSYSTDTDSGHYLVAAGRVGTAIGGSLIVETNSTGLTFSVANPQILGGDSDGVTSISGGVSNVLGGSLRIYGDTHGSKPDDFEVYGSAVLQLAYDDSASTWNFQANDVIVDNNGGLIVGHSSRLTIGGGALETQFLGTGAADGAMAVGRWGDNNLGPQFMFLKSKGAAVGDVSSVSGSAVLGDIQFLGDDGTDFATQGARIRVLLSGTAGSNRIPTEMQFATGTDASPTVLTTALTLDSAQLATFAANVTVTGSVIGGLTIGTGNLTVTDGITVLNNNTAGTGLLLNQDTDQNALEIDSEAIMNDVIFINAPTQTTGTIINIGNCNDLTSGSILFAHC